MWTGSVVYDLLYTTYMSEVIDTESFSAQGEGTFEALISRFEREMKKNIAILLTREEHLPTDSPTRRDITFLKDIIATLCKKTTVDLQFRRAEKKKFLEKRAT